VGVFFAPMDAAAIAFCLPLAHALRTGHGGMRVEIDLRGSKLPSQLKRAERLRSRLAVIVGDEEIKSGLLTVKDLASRTQHKVPVAELEAKVRGLLD
jgi:histidyl-tRNA synthetase